MALATRREKFAERLATRGLDGALLCHSRDVFYLAGTAQPAMLGVFRGAWHLFVRSGMGFVLRETDLDETAIVRERDPGTALLQLLGDAGSVRMGTELDLLTAREYLRLVEVAPGVTWNDISPDIMALRAIKEDGEVAAVERAAAALHQGHVAAAAWRPGMTELDASALVEDAHRRAGHEGTYFLRQRDFDMGRGPLASGPNIGRISGVVFTVSGVGLSPAVPAGASRREMQEGDLVVVDIPTCVDGYHADQTRTYALGRASDVARALHDGLRGVADRLIADLRPGMTAGGAYEIATAQAERVGIGDGFLAFPDGVRAHFIGHGVGLEANETPFLIGGSQAPLAAGMVLAIELHACDGPSGTLVKLEDMVLLEEDGARILNLSPRELTVIG